MSRIVRRGATPGRYATRPVEPRGASGRGSVAAVGRDMRKALSETLAGVMTAAAEAVTDATPVDTGHAQSNWILSTGAPYTGVDGSRENVSEAAQVHGLEKMANYDVGRDGRIYLVNNVPYMRTEGDRLGLEDGSSPQQPEPGWITKALLTASSKAPKGRRAVVRKALRAMGKSALRGGK